MWKWGLLAVVAVLAAAGTAWVWLRYDFEKVNWTWGVIAGVLAVYVVLDQVTTNRQAISPAAAHRRAAADELAELIRRDPTDEALLRAVDEPYPLPVRWRNGPERFFPSWRAIGRSSDAGPMDLSGRNGRLWSRYRAIPSGRLLVLGPPGSGKSIIALRMARELPLHREPDMPVPVLVPVESWDPGREAFHDWLVDRIARRFPQVAADHPRRDAVLRDLVETNLVVPVLDGLDEVPEERLTACLEELNALPTQRFVLTCRSFVYDRYLSQGEKLRGTAVVMLEPLTPAEVADYLVDAAPLHQADNWSSVATKIGTDAELTTALSTPLMVAMARSAFDQPGTDPRELVPLAAERGRRSVEDELLTRAVDAALRSRRGGQGLQRWEPDKARRYLSFLAAHMESLDLREFRWWQLSAALPRPFWALVDGLRTGLAVWLALTLARDALTSMAGIVTDATSRDLLYMVARNAGGFAVAASVLAASRAMMRGGAARASGSTPTRMVFVGGLRAFRDGLRDGLIGGLFLGLLAWTLLWLVTPSPELVALLDRIPGLPPWSVPTRSAVVLGAAWWVYQAARSGLRVDFAAPAAELDAMSAVETVREDRAAIVASAVPAVVLAVVRVLAGVAALRLTGVLSGSPSLAQLISAGTGLGLGWWLHRRAGGAWVQFSVARVVLTARGRTPYRLLAFLRYMETVGLLRHGVGAYRFRHTRLQNRLAAGLVLGGRGSRLREEFAIELARAGYWTEALGNFAAVTETRAASVGFGDDLTVAALRKALLAGAAAGEWTRLAELLALMPEPLTPGTVTPVLHQRQRISWLITARAPISELRAAAEELRLREHGASPAESGADEFLATLCYADGDIDAARGQLNRLLAAGSAGDGRGRSAPIGAGLLARLLLDEGDAAAAVTVCHHELLLADHAQDRADLLVLVQTWTWAVEVMRRVTDEQGELLRRIRGALAEQQKRSRQIELTRRELAEIGLQACHTMIGHPTWGPLAVAVTRKLIGVLADPDIVLRTISRSAPMWHAG
ncbi:hypothetical protein DLJ47_23250 [Micromonospora sp. S4605]|nr:hypothetical protein DLJ47_23250 [Micromonospora sp. S4605]